MKLHFDLYPPLSASSLIALSLGDHANFSLGQSIVDLKHDRWWDQLGGIRWRCLLENILLKVFLMDEVLDLLFQLVTLICVIVMVPMELTVLIFVLGGGRLQ